MQFRELKEEPLWKLKRERRNRRLIHSVLLKALLAIIAGILIGFLILGITEPREVIAETVPETELEVISILVEASEMKVIPEIEETITDEETVSETENAVETEPEMEYMGTFKLTAYCSCRECCGKWAGGPTKSGIMPQAGRTIAVDKRVIPLGTRVYIEGYGEYVAEDTGSAIKGNCIDVYMDSHNDARHFANGAGSCMAEVYIIK